MIHGLFLPDFKSEVSLGSGIADGIIDYNHGQEEQTIALELKCNGNAHTLWGATQQIKRYNEFFQAVSNQRKTICIALNFNNQAPSEDKIINYHSVERSVRHDTSEEEAESLSSSQTTKRKKEAAVRVDQAHVELDKSDCKRRRPRSVEGCIDEEESDDMLYEPLERDTTATKEEIQEARRYAEIAMMLALHSNREEANVALDTILAYNRNIGEIINEGAQNHSQRELRLLKMHYTSAHAFMEEYGNRLLEENLRIENQNSWLLHSGRYSILVIRDKNRYKLYSSDWNYRYVLQTQEGKTDQHVMRLATDFLALRSSSSSTYTRYSLSTDSNLIEEATAFLSKDLIWLNPDAFLSDQVLLSREYHNLIEGISTETIGALFSIDEKPVDMARLVIFF